MFPVQRALLIVNRAAGTGQGDLIAEKLGLMFEKALSEHAEVQIALVDNHQEARACAASFVRPPEMHSVIFAGGGGGTLRAVIQGICGDDPSKPLPGQECVRVGALRLGSGNVLAKRFGVPRDPVAGLRGLLENLKTGRTVPCCVMRCEVWKKPGHSEIHHAVTLAGFGQFGRIPGDLARWHLRMPRLHKGAARLFGIERLTNLEYALAYFLRSLSCVLFSGSAEAVEIDFQNQKQRMRLLSGLAMSFQIEALPLKPPVSVEQEAVSIYLIPYKGRLSPLLQMWPQRLIRDSRYIGLEKNQRLEIRLTDRDSVKFFLDEDPLSTWGRLSFEVAGSITFVPGSNYRFVGAEGEVFT